MIKFIFYIVFISFAYCGVSSAQKPEDVIAKLAKVKQATKVITCELSVEVVTHSRWNRQTKKDELIAPIKYAQIRNGIVDFTSGKYRWDYSGEYYENARLGIRPYCGASTFDGKVLRSIVYPNGVPTNAKPGTATASDYGEFEGDLRAHGLPMELRPLFMSHGVLPAANQRPLYPSRFHTYDVAANADTFKVAKGVAEPSSGLWLDTIMQPSKAADNIARYCFDPNKDYALIRWIELIRGKISSTTSLQYTRRVDRYVLTGWTYKTQADDVPIQTFIISVNKIDYSSVFEDSVTALSPQPGMIAGKMKYEPGDVDNPKYPVLERFNVVEDGSLRPLDVSQNWWRAYRGCIAASVIFALITLFRIQKSRNLKSNRISKPSSERIK